MRMLGTAHDVCQTFRVLGEHRQQGGGGTRVLHAHLSSAGRRVADQAARSRQPLRHGSASEQQPRRARRHGRGRLRRIRDGSDSSERGSQARCSAPPCCSRNPTAFLTPPLQEIKRLKARRIILVGKTPYCRTPTSSVAPCKPRPTRAMTWKRCRRTPTKDCRSRCSTTARSGIYGRGPRFTHIGCMGDMISLRPCASEQRSRCSSSRLASRLATA